MATKPKKYQSGGSVNRNENPGRTMARNPRIVYPGEPGYEHAKAYADAEAEIMRLPVSRRPRLGSAESESLLNAMTPGGLRYKRGGTVKKTAKK